MMTQTIETRTLEIKHYGSVRGSCNSHARLHLSISAPEIENASAQTDETRALFAPWDEAFSIQGTPWTGWDYKINSRREFAIVPLIIRKAIASGYDVLVSQWDQGLRGSVSLKEDPALFWQFIAQSQMWFEK